MENLYFHHSHQRGPKPYPSPSLIVTTQADPASFTDLQARTSPPPSSLSFKVGVSNRSTSPTFQDFASDKERVGDDGSGISSLHSPNSEAFPYSSKVPIPLSSLMESNSLVSADIMDREDRRSATPYSTSRISPVSPTPITSFYVHPRLAPTQLVQQGVITSGATGSASSSRTCNSPAPKGISSSAPTPRPSSLSLSYHPDATQGPSSSNPTRELYNHVCSAPSSSSTLTYDSFWLSRSFRKPNGNTPANVHTAGVSPSILTDMGSGGDIVTDVGSSSMNKAGKRGGRRNTEKYGEEGQNMIVN